MVGIMKLNPGERLASLANAIKTAVDLPSKLDCLNQLMQNLPREDFVFPPELLPKLFDLLSDEFGVVRKFATEIIGEIGLKHAEYVPEVVPVIINELKDPTPAVARQAIACGTNLFRSTLERVAVQGLHASEMDSFLETSWDLILKFKEEVFSIAFQAGSGGVRLLAMKFVEAVILLYTPDPSGPLEPPHDGNPVEFNISMLRGGHPVLNVGDLSIEASQKLVLLLDQLRLPGVKVLCSSAVITLINSLSKIAKKRPAYYGRILPVLLNLDPRKFSKGVHVSVTHRALKIAFRSCLECTHPAAAPWRDRLVGALEEIESAGLTKQPLDNDVGKTNGSIEGNDVSVSIKEEKPVVTALDGTESNSGRKRFVSEDLGDVHGDDATVKRARSTPSISEESSKEFEGNANASQSQFGTSPTKQTESERGDSGPVQQLVAMFGALVAQGEKAIGSLEILISSISTDLLAEVVMANMHNLSPNSLQAEGSDELVMEMSIVGSDTQVKYPPSFLAGVLSLSTTFAPIAQLINTYPSVIEDTTKPKKDEEHRVSALVDPVFVTEDSVLLSGLPAPSDDVPKKELGDGEAPSDSHELGNRDSEIPGLEPSSEFDGVSESLVSPTLASADMDGTSQDNVATLASADMDGTDQNNAAILPFADMDGTSQDNAATLASADVDKSSQDKATSVDREKAIDVPSISTEKSEEFSPKATSLDSSSIVSSTTTSVVPQYVLPKISAPIVELTDDQKDGLQMMAFARIVEAYKQISSSNGSQLRFSLLAQLGVEFPSEDPWKLLQEHILSDYLNHEGHELTVRVLYRLHGEAEEEHDFISSTAAASVYETFLLTVAEALRDSYPPSDKSLSRLLGDAPYLPKSVLKFLESLCCPGSADVAEKEAQSGDRVTQGLSIAWSLILQRPGIRDACLNVTLQSAVHHLEEVRMKAIRLVANKLYPLSSITKQIEDFAKEKLFSVVSSDAAERAHFEGSTNEFLQDSEPEKSLNDHQSQSGSSRDMSSDTNQLCSSSLSIPEAQRCLSLFFALCTKKHSLFHEMFEAYKSASNAVKQAIHRQVPLLVRTMGLSSELLAVISDIPVGSESLLMQVLQILTDGAVPSSELISTIKKLFDAKVKDAEILFPILPFMPKDEVLRIFPHLVNLPSDKFQIALTRLLQGSHGSGPALSPAEVLIAIHGIDPSRDGIPLKKVTDACNACFDQRQVFTQQVLANVLNELVQLSSLPLLFMRTVLQAIGAYPALVDFVMEILSCLVTKQIWKYPKLWVGFLKCAQLTKPQSFKVLLQLPPPQLENALNRVPALKAPLVAHASQPDIQSSLPRAALVVLGIVSDCEASTQPETSQPEQAQDSEAASSQLQASQTEASDSQASQAKTEDTANSENVTAGAEKSKETSSS